MIEDIDISQFLDLVNLYRLLIEMDVCDKRVIETVVQMIMQFTPLRMNVKI